MLHSLCYSRLHYCYIILTMLYYTHYVILCYSHSLLPVTLAVLYSLLYIMLHYVIHVTLSVILCYTVNVYVSNIGQIIV